MDNMNNILIEKSEFEDTSVPDSKSIPVLLSVQLFGTVKIYLPYSIGNFMGICTNNS